MKAAALAPSDSKSILDGPRELQVETINLCLVSCVTKKSLSLYN